MTKHENETLELIIRQRASYTALNNLKKQAADYFSKLDMVNKRVTILQKDLPGCQEDELY